ncbi:MAG: homocysteine S-methyltransferase [Cyclobacteriaceae bacterium]|nr:homocysteine S-methyltransferase [Cyclobacteriaceae bacterium]
MNIRFPLLIDGGLSNELERQGCDLNHKLWSASMLAGNPEAIINAHLAYLKAGAQCITTSSYQATLPGFMQLGYDQTTAEAMIIKTVTLAEEAIKRFEALGNNTSGLFIAASIGPYGAYLSDGSEYRGNYDVSDAILFDFHMPRIKLLDETNAHFFACETIPSFQEAKVLAEILKQTKKPAWITFSCKDDKHINDGTPISECASLLKDHPNVFAIGVNCTAPQHISGLVKELKANAGSKRIVVYPNSGEVFQAKTKTWLGLADPNAFASMSQEWISLGVDIMGGCCRIGPDHIRKMNDALNA